MVRAALLSYDLVMSWDAELTALTTRIAAPLFARPEPRASFTDLVRGLLADVPRKNSWQLSDHIGHSTANRFEHLLDRAKWDVEALRDQVRDYVVEHLGSPDAVLIADDTQAIKKGDRSVGVARQYCGATGQVENCQVMPMLTYASRAGHAFINRRLYLPESWAGDPDRRALAGVPEHVAFTTRPHLVIEMLEQEVAAATPFAYLTADAGYGRDPDLRAFCHRAERPITYVMAVPVDLPVRTPDGGGEPVGHALDRLLAPGRPLVREHRACGTGTKGIRSYDWASITVAIKDQAPAPGHAHTLLTRRSVADPAEIEFFLAHAIEGTAISKLIQIAGMRWKIEEYNEYGKDLLGLTQYQVRKWTPWHRHVTTVMLALAFLTVTRAHLTHSIPAERGQGTDRHPPPTDLRM
ncbi:IS701 family transposase [Microtetraspora malaysiensis]|uniref:IS701 family transposase n=1 Tax=Microtetraspora malaysiensis TaxID=161358 RepID=UPI003D8D36B6